MQLHAAPVGFGHHKLKRIPERDRSFAAIGEVAAPRLEVAFIERVGLRTYLKNHSIDTG